VKNHLIITILLLAGLNGFGQLENEIHNKFKHIPRPLLVIKSADSTISYDNGMFIKRTSKGNLREYWESKNSTFLKTKIKICYGDTFEFFESDNKGLFERRLPLHNENYTIVVSKSGYNSKTFEINTQGASMSASFSINADVLLSKGSNYSQSKPVVIYRFSKKSSEYEHEIQTKSNFWHSKTDYRGSIDIEFEVVDNKYKPIKSNIHILFKSDTIFSYNSIRTDNPYRISLLPQKTCSILFESKGFITKKIDVNTIGSNNNYQKGYLVPIQILLEKGASKNKEIQPSGYIYYDEKGDRYKSNKHPIKQ
jgi:hypothetical protein